MTELKDDTAIQKLKMLKAKPKQKDWWTEISDEEKNAIDKGLKGIKAGHVKPHKKQGSCMKNGYQFLWSDRALFDLRLINHFLSRTKMDFKRNSKLCKRLDKRLELIVINPGFSPSRVREKT